MSQFFSDKESERLVHAISEIEQRTIGEIRIHIEDLCDLLPYERALVVFDKLQMYRTAARTGILIYISTEDHKIAIVGDEGIHSRVGTDFWDQIVSKMAHEFSKSNIIEGLLEGLDMIGQKLIHYFPEKGSQPKDELPNEITYGTI